MAKQPAHVDNVVSMDNGDTHISNLYDAMKSLPKEPSRLPVLEWKVAKDNPEIVAEVRRFRGEVEDYIDQWGRMVAGVEDLSLAHLTTLPRNPDAQVSNIWNPTKGEWFRYREGDEVPRWLRELGKTYKDYMYDPKGNHGRLVTPDMLSKFRGRGGQSKKVTSLGDL